MPDQAAKARVRRVLRAAARLADPADPLHCEAMARLPGETGLPELHIQRAIEQSLEREASDGELASLCATVPPKVRVHVVLSSNVFVAPVRALALAWASAPEVRVRPSRRAPAVPELLLRALAEQGDREGSLTLVDALDVQPGEAVHAYGRDETLAQLRASLPAGARLWGHGHGFGVAVVDEATSAQAPLPLASDVALFDQRGCLSPRLVICVGPEPAADAFACAMHRSLEASAVELPTGAVDQAERVARQSYAATMEAVGLVLVGPTAVVGLQHRPESVLLPAFPRGLHLVSAPTLDEAAALLAPLARWITCLGGQGAAADALAAVAPRARRAALGRMQRPPLDGPVDLRTRAPT